MVWNWTEEWILHFTFRFYYIYIYIIDFIFQQVWKLEELGQMKLYPPGIGPRGPFHERFFHRNSNSMEISFHSHLNSNSAITTKFCTWHDSCAVVACAKICCDPMASNGITVRRSFHRIWIAGKISLVKRAPDWNILEELVQPHGCCWQWDCFKNTNELLYLGALKCTHLNKRYIFHCMGNTFYVEFHAKYLAHTLKGLISIHCWKFKRSYI